MTNEVNAAILLDLDVTVDVDVDIKITYFEIAISKPIALFSIFVLYLVSIIDIGANCMAACKNTFT